jgi:hypothetical protein
MYNGRPAQKYPPTSLLGGMEDNRMKRGLFFGGIIIAAMLAFELFNYTTTDFALTNLLGDLRFIGLRWATILAVAFCGMDFAGIARLFTPEKGRSEHTETWYLLAAWFLAATMNAMLTWWGVSLALLTHEGLGNEILSRQTLLSVVPVFVAVLVWLIRILLIGLLSMAGERLFTFMEQNLREGDEPQARPAAPQQRPANSAPARLPTAEWAGGSHRQTPVTPPVMKTNAGSARVIGNAADDAPRAATVAERHGYGRSAQNQNTTTTNRAPAPSNTPVRPAPKPNASPASPAANHNPNNVRPIPARVPAPAAGGNGNGLHRTTDYDFDD